jgi:adenosine deaminase
LYSRYLSVEVSVVLLSISEAISSSLGWRTQKNVNLADHRIDPGQTGLERVGTVQNTQNDCLPLFSSLSKGNHWGKN